MTVKREEPKQKGSPLPTQPAPCQEKNSLERRSGLHDTLNSVPEHGHEQIRRHLISVLMLCLVPGGHEHFLLLAARVRSPKATGSHTSPSGVVLGGGALGRN